MNEARAYRELYQEAGARATSDGAIAVMQGRSVGGSTTVNWTSSFRTPKQTLEHWAAQHEVKGHGVDEMQPWFEQMEQRLDVMRWEAHERQQQRAQARLRRSSAGRRTSSRATCKRLLELGLLRLRLPGQCQAVDAGVDHPRGAAARRDAGAPAARAPAAACRRQDHAARSARRCAPTAARRAASPVTIQARHFIAAGGAINTPALLLRSELPDPHQRLGKRTLIHPVVLSMAQMPERIDAFYGAPQSIASDHFQWKDGATGPMGYKLEVPPMFPGIASGVLNRRRRRRSAAGDGRASRTPTRCSRCCATASSSKARAAACAWPTTAARCSTTTSATTSGTACAAPT